MKRFVARYSPLFILAGLCIVLAVISPEFRQPDNFRNVAYRTCVVGIVATGQTLVILTAGIDLSVGSVAAVSGVVACMLMVRGAAYASLIGLAIRALGHPHLADALEVSVVVASVGAGVLVGSLCGAISGLLSTKGKLPPFIATLGMMMAASGAALLLSGAQPIFGLPESFRYLGGARGWWIPVVITGLIAGVFAVVLTFTRFGRALYATGGSLQGARLSGIAVDRVRTAAFALCGMLSGFAGVMLASKVGIGDPKAAEGMELDAIAACVIGGASLMGGEGSCVGSLAGALIMTVLVNFCNLRQLDAHWQKVLVGSLIIVLVYYDTFRKRKAGLIRD
ncbi:MAG: ABC transporter permease [Candidatus Hydrogenedentes bacterium]|nr:ABC transporter permease [Candidatus Hydrogenedentota bacterium]